MTSVADIQIIAADARGLTAADRSALRDAADELRQTQLSLHTAQNYVVKLEQQLAAQADRLRELTPKPLVKMPDMYGYVWLHSIRFPRELPSWAQF